MTGKLLSLGILAFALLATPAFAEDSAIQVILKDHKFAPAEVEAPAGKPLTLEIVNQDSTAAEFESKDLRVEKIAPAGGKATVKVRALKPGRYKFFDDYHESTAQGFLVVK